MKKLRNFFNLVFQKKATRVTKHIITAIDHIITGAVFENVIIKADLNDLFPIFTIF